MLSRAELGLEETVAILRAAGETTRLRLIALLSHNDLTVTELMDILGQSQPRISRHLRLLTEAGLVERHQEGAWAYFRTVELGPAAEMVGRLREMMDPADAQLRRDSERLTQVRQQRALAADQYFAANAASWDELRSFHVDESKVEAAMLAMVGNQPIQSMLDLGTGTGRLLELFAPIYNRAMGIDTNRDMLSVARAKLDTAGLGRVPVRQADIFNLPTPSNQFDLVTIHQVLHFLDDPAAAIREAARALAPSGRLLIADFAPHDLEFLRDSHMHRRLGFSHDQIGEWLIEAGLEIVETVDLRPEGNAKGALLTVTLWLARDTRILMADLERDQQQDKTITGAVA